MRDPGSQKMTRRTRRRLVPMKPMTTSKLGTRVGEPRPKIRGRPFQPGNPGRPPGSKNRVTRLVEQLVAGDAEELSQKMIELAKQGNVRCLEYCLDRLLPKRSGRPLDLQLPSINGVHDIIAAMAAVATAVNNGDVTAEEAAHLVHWFEGYTKIITTHDIVVRLEALESEAKERGDLVDRTTEQ
jgi:hypothetical protein